MIIEDTDFRIIKDGKNYTLYLLKPKKEIKSDSDDKYGLHGYYSTLTSVLKNIIAFRSSKKYPGKEKKEPVVRSYKSLVESQLKLVNSLLLTHSSVIDLENFLKQKLNGNIDLCN